MREPAGVHGGHREYHRRVDQDRRAARAEEVRLRAHDLRDLPERHVVDRVLLRRFGVEQIVEQAQRERALLGAESVLQISEAGERRRVVDEVEGGCHSSAITEFSSTMSTVVPSSSSKTSHLAE